MQFCRCLDQHLSLRLSEADYDFLVGKYGDRKRGTVNYRAFCNAMEKGAHVCTFMSTLNHSSYYLCEAFDPTVLDGKPEKQIEAFQQ